MIEHSELGICAFDGEGRILWANPGLASMLGFESNRDLEGSGSDALFRDAAVAAELFAVGTRFARIRDVEAELRRRDGSPLSAVLNGRRVSDEEGRLSRVELFIRDVTGRRAVTERLAQAQKLEALGRITGAIAHDFNNLLAAIVTPSEFLLQDLTEGSSHWEDVKSINEAATRAADLTNQLLAFSRRRVLRPVPVDIGQVVSGLRRLLPRLAGKGVSVDVLIGEDLPAVHAEASQLEQVLVNLVLNARDALPHGGTIQIDATARGPLGEQVGPGEATRLVLTVADDGEGMDADTCKRVFDPFFTTKPDGTGLGLATVAAIVKQHHGEIHVESEPGRGTRFQISLPVARRRESILTSQPAPAEDVPRAATILIVEDDPGVAELTRRALIRAGHEATIAETGERAVEMIREGDRVDLLLIDMMLPGIDGLETARRVRALRPEVSIVYMSGYAGVEETRQIELDRKALNLQKPFTVKVLRDTVAGALRRVREHESA